MIDFIFVGNWVHHPEPVAHITPRPMGQPDEIKAGWGITGLWCLWCAFVGAAACLSALLAGAVWCVNSPNHSTAATPASTSGFHALAKLRRFADWKR
jgi:hypothetical protein